MWHLDKIPKILHVYWGGSSLPKLRYLTIESFAKYNPDWEVRVYVPATPVEGHSWSTFEQKYDGEWND